MLSGSKGGRTCPGLRTCCSMSASASAFCGCSSRVARRSGGTREAVSDAVEAGAGAGQSRLDRPCRAPSCIPAASLAFARIRRAFAAFGGDSLEIERQDCTAFSMSVLELPQGQEKERK